MTSVMPTPWKVESVIDTRHRDEHGKPIPDSGDPVNCECCGKLVYIHATLRHGERCMIVGQQCAVKLTGRPSPKAFTPARYSWHAVALPSPDLTLVLEDGVLLQRSGDLEAIAAEARAQSARQINAAKHAGLFLFSWVYDRVTRRSLSIVSANELVDGASD